MFVLLLRLKNWVLNWGVNAKFFCLFKGVLMASHRPFPPQSAFPPPPPSQIPPQPPQPPPSQQQQQQRPIQYPQGYTQMAPPLPHSSAFPQNYAQQQHYPPPPPPPPAHQQYPFQPPLPPPTPESPYPPPPPPPPAVPQQPEQPQQQQPPAVYSRPLQYSHYANQPLLPPPIPSSSLSSSIPPPPPPSSSPLPPPPPSKESRIERDKGFSRGRTEHRHSNQDVGKQKHHKPLVPPVASKAKGTSGRVETEEERRLRKKREFEKQRQEDRHRQQLKESQNSILQKTQMLSAQKGHGSMVGSRMGDRRATPLLTADRSENRLKKPTTFLCKMKFRNELPDPSAQMKLMKFKRDEDRFARYTITSMEKMWKPQLHLEPDLGIPLDLLDLSVYNPPRGPRPPLAPEDEELLHDDDVVTPVKKDGIRKKERPTDKGVSWLVKTQYISPLSMESTKQSLAEKQAKELKEMEDRSLLENLNDRERQINAIQNLFEANKLPPVHATNKNLQPVEVMPLLPYFDRYQDKHVMVTFDGAPTADSESYIKLDESVRDACEQQALMKACVATGSDPANPEKFLAYMAPNHNELSKDIYNEEEEISYSWLREYHWDVRGNDMDENFLVTFHEDEARFVALPTRLGLKKKKAREGRSGDEVEHFPVPSTVTVKNRPTAATTMEGVSGGKSNSKGHILKSRMARIDEDNMLERHHHADQSSGSEDDMSE